MSMCWHCLAFVQLVSYILQYNAYHSLPGFGDIVIFRFSCMCVFLIDMHVLVYSFMHWQFLQALGSIFICLATICLSAAGFVFGVQNILEADSASHLIRTQPWSVLPIPLGVCVALPATQTLIATWAPSGRLRHLFCSGIVEIVVLTVFVFAMLCVPIAAIHSSSFKQNSFG